jgi:hypothetical protein
MLFSFRFRCQDDGTKEKAEETTHNPIPFAIAGYR